MRRRVRIEPLATARQVAIVLLGRAGRWNKTAVARSFGRDPATFHSASRAVENRAETDDDFRRRFQEAEQRFRESLELINGEGRL
jgi:chromosomal replication initiation ATPase DnaA